MKHFVTLSEIIKPAKLRRAGETDYPILSMTMHDGLVDQADKFKKRIASIDTSPYKVIKRNQLVVGFPIDEGVLSFQDLYDEAMVSPAYNVWDLKQPEQVNTKYFQDYLRSPIALNYYASHLRGTTARRRTIPNDVFLQLPVYLPPLAEQQRLAAILDEADALRALRRRGLARFDELAQSLFLELFGDPALNSMNWETVRLGDVCESVSTWNPKSADEEETFSYIDIASIDREQKMIGEVTQCENQNAPSRARQLVETDDILISTVRPNLNTVAIVGAELNGATASTGFCILRAIKNAVSSRFLFHWAMTPAFIEDMVKQATGQSYPAVSDRIIKNSVFPLPPLALQEEFAQQIGQLETVKARARAQAVELDALFAALSARAFAGELSD